MRDYEGIIAGIEASLGRARLMAVSKTRTIEEIMEVYNRTDVRLFGENHVQEIVQKFSAGKPADMEVHMIGHLQSNKVNKVVPLVDMIESVDSLSLLRKIDNAAAKCSKVQDVLLELNSSGEEAKSGFQSDEELVQCLEASLSMPNVRVRGLMTVGPVACAPEDKDRLTAECFAHMAVLRKDCQERFPQLGGLVLSMGMSQDWRIALEHGTDIVRIGTAIFGERDYGQKN